MSHKDAPPITQQQQDFERWWIDRKGPGYVGFGRDKHGEYFAEWARDAWAAWLHNNDRKLAETVLAWWQEHQYDTAELSDGDEYNIYDEKPLFVRMAELRVGKYE